MVILFNLSKTDWELSEIIMEINDLRRLATLSREKAQKRRARIRFRVPSTHRCRRTTNPYVKEHAR
jgi:hypothetical protein